MPKNDLRDQYFEWLCELIDYDERSFKSYSRLFNLLHKTDFQVIIGMDENRAEDGIDLRYRFGESCGYHQAEIATCLDISPCSVFEMMIALALRCKESIMDNPDEGGQIGKLFWVMISNLGLESMSDERYDNLYCLNVIHRFLNREYSRNGEGGLFVIENCKYDLRSVEIWYQMCWYLDSILDF